MSIPNPLKARLSKERPMTSITLRIPVDVVESMRNIAPLRGLAGYQTLLKLYISEGLRRDEAHTKNEATTRIIAALKKHGVEQAILNDVMQELETA